MPHNKLVEVIFQEVCTRASSVPIVNRKERAFRPILDRRLLFGSDYIQNDEVWWIEAQQNVIYLEDGIFDESAGVYASEIALKIVDDEGNFVGVIKAVINVEQLITTDQ